MKRQIILALLVLALWGGQNASVKESTPRKYAHLAWKGKSLPVPALSALNAEENKNRKKKSRIWKPILITIAVGGTTYLLYEIRTR